MDVFTTGQLAKRASVNRTTVRYYERRGLLVPAMRSLANYRLYSEESLTRLRFIKHAQDLGFTLRETEELLGLVARKRSSSEVCALAREKIAAVENKIHQLQSFKKQLQRLTTACTGKGPIEKCIIMKELYS
jgi:MerR family transcriptional regulator, copper efflux regulator